MNEQICDAQYGGCGNGSPFQLNEPSRCIYSIYQQGLTNLLVVSQLTHYTLIHYVLMNELNCLVYEFYIVILSFNIVV